MNWNTLEIILLLGLVCSVIIFLIGLTLFERKIKDARNSNRRVLRVMHASLTKYLNIALLGIILFTIFGISILFVRYF
jgi:Na+-transporting NADH:ubiquinone oxidoreductase subunit NqrC